MFKIILITLVVSFSLPSFAGYEFERNVQEIQVLSDRVRINIGTTYGTCGKNEGWWGWMLNAPASNHWLSVVLTAQAQGKKIVVLDNHGSCSGIGDGIGLEGIYLKVTS